jgi:carboxymethylenebutenolidase
MTRLPRFLFSLLALALFAAPAPAGDGNPETPWYKANDDSIRQSKAEFTSGGKTIPVERFEPKQDGKYPVIVIVHGADGLQFEPFLQFYRGFGQLLARNGYVALLPHYFERTDSKFGDLGTILKHFATWTGTLGDAVAFAAREPNGDANRIGLLGASLGASLALTEAGYDTRVKAVVEFFGALPILGARPEKLPPVLILHGDKDWLVQPSEARKLEEQLKKHNRVYEMKIYEGQGHGFIGEPARDAARRTREFFDKYVRDAK